MATVCIQLTRNLNNSFTYFVQLISLSYKPEYKARFFFLSEIAIRERRERSFSISGNTSEYCGTQGGGWGAAARQPTPKTKLKKYRFCRHENMKFYMVYASGYISHWSRLVIGVMEYWKMLKKKKILRTYSSGSVPPPHPPKNSACATALEIRLRVKRAFVQFTRSVTYITFGFIPAPLNVHQCFYYIFWFFFFSFFL